MRHENPSGDTVTGYRFFLHCESRFSTRLNSPARFVQIPREALYKHSATLPIFFLSCHSSPPFPLHNTKTSTTLSPPKPSPLLCPLHRFPCSSTPHDWIHLQQWPSTCHRQKEALLLWRVVSGLSCTRSLFPVLFATLARSLAFVGPSRFIVMDPHQQQCPPAQRLALGGRPSSLHLLSPSVQLLP